MMFSDEKSYIVPTVFAPSDCGVFSIYPDDSEPYFSSYWDTCREQFAKKFNKDSLGFFLSVQENVSQTCKFIQACEDLLRIHRRSKFFYTDMKNVIFIRPAEFWKSCYIRRSLLTLLCRNGIFYNDNLEKTLFGEVPNVKMDKIDSCYKFARETKFAIMRFFAGYNYYIGHGPLKNDLFPEKHGWAVEFTNKSKNYVKNVLIKKESTAFLSFYGSNVFFN